MKQEWVRRDYLSIQRMVGVFGVVLGGAIESLGAYLQLSGNKAVLATRIAMACCDEFGSAILSFGFAGCVLWFTHSGRLIRLQTGLAAVGRMALTNYLLQSVAMNAVFAGFAMNLYGKLSRLEVLCLFTVIYAAQIVVSIVWLRSFTMGPVEQIWRWLTYRRL